MLEFIRNLNELFWMWILVTVIALCFLYSLGGSGLFGRVIMKYFEMIVEWIRDVFRD